MFCHGARARRGCVLRTGLWNVVWLVRYVPGVVLRAGADERTEVCAGFARMRSSLGDVRTGTNLLDLRTQIVRADWHWSKIIDYYYLLPRKIIFLLILLWTVFIFELENATFWCGVCLAEIVRRRFPRKVSTKTLRSEGLSTNWTLQSLSDIKKTQNKWFSPLNQNWSALERFSVKFVKKRYETSDQQKNEKFGRSDQDELFNNVCY